MKTKTIFIIVITALITIILMKNTDRVDFWLFGTQSVPKLAVLAVFFVLGIVVGLLLRRTRKKPHTDESYILDERGPYGDGTRIGEIDPPLDPSDEDYIR